MPQNGANRRLSRSCNKAGGSHLRSQVVSAGHGGLQHLCASGRLVSDAFNPGLNGQNKGLSRLRVLLVDYVEAVSRPIAAGFCACFSGSWVVLRSRILPDNQILARCVLSALREATTRTCRNGDRLRTPETMSSELI